MKTNKNKQELNLEDLDLIKFSVLMTLSGLKNKNGLLYDSLDQLYNKLDEMLETVK